MPDGDDGAELHREEPVATSTVMSGRSCSITSTPQPVSLDEAGDDRPERLGLGLRQAGRGLVEQQHLRLGRHDAGDVDRAAGAGRQLADELVGERAEAEQLDEPVDPADSCSSLRRCEGIHSAASAGLRYGLALERDGDVLAHGQRREQPGALERAAEAEPRAGVGRQRGDVDAVEDDAGPRRLDEAGDDVEQRGLAGAVRAR